MLDQRFLCSKPQNPLPIKRSDINPFREEHPMPRRRKPHDIDFDRPLDGPDIPPPAPVVIEGPTAHELAAHGSEFMTQALLVKAKVDHPDAPPLAEVMADDAFQARALMMVLSLLGVGEAYVGSLTRLLGAVHSLEKRLFSEEVLAELTPATLAELYKLSVNQTDNRAKYIAGLLATVDTDATRTRLAAYGTAGEAVPTAPLQKPKKGKGKQAKAPAAVTLAKPHPTILLHQIHTADEE